MSKLLKELLYLLDNMTPEELEENFKSLEKYTNIGPSAREYVDKISKTT